MTRQGRAQGLSSLLAVLSCVGGKSGGGWWVGWVWLMLISPWRRTDNSLNLVSSPPFGFALALRGRCRRWSIISLTTFLIKYSFKVELNSLQNTSINQVSVARCQPISHRCRPHLAPSVASLCAVSLPLLSPDHPLPRPSRRLISPRLFGRPSRSAQSQKGVIAHINIRSYSSTSYQLLPCLNLTTALRFSLVSEPVVSDLPLGLSCLTPLHRAVHSISHASHPPLTPRPFTKMPMMVSILVPSPSTTAASTTMVPP